MSIWRFRALLWVNRTLSLGTVEVSARPSDTTRCTGLTMETASWAKAFSEAMLKLSLLGLSEDKIASLVDCTDILHWDVE